MLDRAQEGPVLRLTLKSPPANALSIAVIEALQAALDAAGDDTSVRVIVIAATGKLFSAGHDLKEMTAHRADEDRGRAFFERTFAECSKLMQSIVELPQPVIAEVDGIATAGVAQNRPTSMPLTPNRDRSDATARSHDATSWQPAAVAIPSTSAITGCGSSTIDRISREQSPKVRVKNASPPSASSRCAVISLRS